MMKGLRVLLLIVALFLMGCSSPTLSPLSTPTGEDAVSVEIVPAALPGRVVLSEVVSGILGNNNYEFVELYNAGTEAVDLRGWSLWYRLNDTQEEKRLYLWSTRSEIPGYGHYLLAREGVELDVQPDGLFAAPLFERWGGLVLRDATQTPVDVLGWGEQAPSTHFEGRAAPAPAGGVSLERLPAGPAGNGADSDDNQADFKVQTVPQPQNRGSVITPLPERRLLITATAPLSVTPGMEFQFDVSVQNHTGVALSGGTLLLPLPEGFVTTTLPSAAISENDALIFSFPALEQGAEQAWRLTLRAPWRYGEMAFGGIYAESEDWYLRSYAVPVLVSVAGGPIPIATARTLPGEVVTVEGIATMYTGGFYSGSDGVKFYLEDESGGIQVYCPGAPDSVRVRIGDRVRVSGEVEVYRDALEIIPQAYPDDVAVLASGGAVPVPHPLSVREANTDVGVLGELNVLQGTLTRIEEFSYSYEADLVDAQGDTLLVYIEKDTRINPEVFEEGALYRITGISELYSTQWQLKPRLQEDLVRVYPPELMIDVLAQNSVAAGDLITYTVTVHNHTEAPLTQVQVTAQPPASGSSVVAVLDGGSVTAGEVAWLLSELAEGGGSSQLRFVVQVDAQAGDRLVMPEATALALEWPSVVSSGPWTTFVGSGVPIWAIQGAGKSSPFVRSEATLEGVVSGVFPELGGFWVQSLEPDDDPATSEGLFVLAGTQEITFTLGDWVVLSGKVRERSGQTLLQLDSMQDVTLLSSGNALPAAVELDPPQSESALYYEALEGMLVAVSEPAPVVAPTTKYGEYVLVHSRWGAERLMKGDPQGMAIFVDDGSAATHGDRSTLPYVVQSGDRVGDLWGPLDFSYDNYKIQPLITPTVLSQALPLPALAPAALNEVSFATFNAENFFDIVDPHPSDPPRPGIREYKLKLAKTAETIVAMGLPTVVGFQEIENLGVLEYLVEEAPLADYGYIPLLLEGVDARGIDVGYLVRGDQATVAGVGAYPAPEGLTSRPPLMITLTVQLQSGEQTLYVLNNHFTSMAGGERATESRRTAQAAWNITLLEELLAGSPQALVAVMGDLNSFYDAPPLDTLRDGGLHHVYEWLAPLRPYTYIYQGESETLDHILVTPALYAHLSRVDVLHVNADYPLSRPDDASAQRTSDHDPLVVVFSFE